MSGGMGGTDGMAFSPDSYPAVGVSTGVTWGSHLDVQPGVQPGPGGIAHLENFWSGAMAAAVATGSMSPTGEYLGALYIRSRQEVNAPIVE
jgi:hypothetical protein